MMGYAGLPGDLPAIGIAKNWLTQLESRSSRICHQVTNDTMRHIMVVQADSLKASNLRFLQLS